MWTVGQTVCDRYRILAEARQGDLGPVYRALDVSSGRTCVLEFITLDPGKDHGWRKFLQPELEKLREIEHPLIVTPEAIEENEDSLLIVHEFFEGPTLEKVIQTQAPLALARACFIARRTAMALEAAHHAGIIHGDLKPSNILLARENNKEQVKVLGFGTFGLKKDSFVNMARLALNGERPLLGNPEYISPEQALGTDAEALDGRSDIYSLGVIFYQALSGRLPFKGRSAMDLLLAHVFSTPPGLAQFPELEVPEVVDSLALRCLAKRREDRPSSATVLVDQLGPWEERVSIVVPAEPERPLLSIEETRNAVPPAPVFESSLPPETLVFPAETKKPEAAAFVADLRSPEQAEPVVLNSAMPHPPASAPSPAKAPSLDVAFDSILEPAVAGAQRSSHPQHPANPGSVIFKSYVPHSKTKPPSKTMTKWIWAAAVLVLLTGAGCGWISYTGRTYWFRPEFLQRRVSTFLSGISGGSASNELPEVRQSPDVTPPAPVSTQPPNQNPGASAAPATPSSETPPPSAQPTTPLAASVPPSAQAASPPPNASSSRNTTANLASIQEAITRGEYFFKRGEYDNAIRAYQAGLAQDPSNPKLRADIARAKEAKAAEAKFLGQ